MDFPFKDHTSYQQGNVKYLLEIPKVNTQNHQHFLKFY